MNLTKRLVIGLSIVMAVFTACKKKSKGYTINGVLNYKNNIDSVYIFEYSTDEKMKTLNAAPVVDNKFTLTGVIDTPQIVIFGNINKNFGSELILENTNYNISSPDRDNVNITGSKIHKKVLGFVSNPEYQKLVKEYETLSEEAFKGVDMNDEKALNEARAKTKGIGNKVMAYEDKIFDDIIKDEKETTLTKLFALVSTQDWKNYPNEKREILLNEYEKELGNHINIRKYREYSEQNNAKMAMAASVKNGNPYKELVAKDINGKKIVLSELVKNNKYTLLEFWASWCSPCRGEIPNLKKVYKKYKDAGLEIYSVSIDSKREEWELALKEEQTTWPNSLLVGDEQKQVEAYGVQGIPASFLIAQDGTIVANNEELREFNLNRTLNKLLIKK